MSDALLPTPFHMRTAAHNGANAWMQRGRFSVAAHYGDPHQESLAARLSVVLADISAAQDLRIHGDGAAALLSGACDRIGPGASDEDFNTVHPNLGCPASCSYN